MRATSAYEPHGGKLTLQLAWLGREELVTVPRGGHKGGTNTAMPHMVAREYRNTASQFTQIPKPQLPMGKS